MVKGQRHKSTFDAYDEGGQRYRLHVWVDVHDVGDREDPDAEIEGLKSIATDDGRAVNRLEKGVYQIVGPNIRLRSDDPEAF